ncbi:MAG: tRNA adenosine(34) deaminase TadA [Acidobacteriia bacterium]|nr:tRNA adenosine(34) deaminase TadA [Terriglobia bacterium]
MSLAIEEAREAEREGEVPIGCVVVVESRVIAGAHNRPIALKDPCAHAEILALRQAGRRLENYRLTEAAVYVTIEPCVMCVGAMINARIKRLVYGAPDSKAGAIESLFRLGSDDRMNHQLEVTSCVLEEGCRALMKDFFASRRA